MRFLLKSILPKKLFSRFFIILISPILVVQVVLVYFFLERHTETILNLVAQDIASDVAVFIEASKNSYALQKKMEALFRFKASWKPKVQLKTRGSYKDSWLYNFLEKAFSDHMSYPHFFRMNEDTLFIQVQLPEGVWYIETSRKRFFSRTTPLVILLTSSSAILMLFISLLFMRNQIRPIRKLAEAANRLGRGDDKFIFKPEGAYEIRQAGSAFLKMRDQVTRHLSERFEMLSHLSHDLRTPLTRIKLQLSCMEETPEVEYLKEDVQQIHEMLEDFLTYSRHQHEENSCMISLKEILLQVCDPFIRQGFHISLSVPTDIVIEGKPLLLKRCFSNLLNNSQKFAQSVCIQGLKDIDQVILTFDDDGPGISPEQYEKVFQPFYKEDQSRNLNWGGVGLGLTIVRDIIAYHGGIVSLSSAPWNSLWKKEGGLRVTITFPI